MARLSIEAQKDREKLNKSPKEAEAEMGKHAPMGVTLLNPGGEDDEDLGDEPGDDIDPQDDPREDPADRGTSPLKVTGGGRPGDDQVKGLGKWWEVIVLDNRNPDAHDIIPITLSSGTPGCRFIKQIRCNEKVAMPERVIRMIERGTKMRSRQRISPKSRLFNNEAAALAANPGSTVVWIDGQMYLDFVRHRYSVQRERLLGGPPAPVIPRGELRRR